MDRKKILIIVRDFVPYSFTLGGSLRVLKLAEFLSRNNVEVYILAARGEMISYFGYEDKIKQWNVTYVDDKLQYLLTRIYNDKKKGKSLVQKFNPVLYFFKKLIDEFSIPDRGRYFVKNFVNKAGEIIRNHHISNIFVSSPPHSTQLIGLKLRKFSLPGKLNIIVDYRDSWNTTGIFAKKNFLSRWLSEWMEKKVLKNANWFSYHSPAVLTKINRKFFEINYKALLVMNGYDAGMKDMITPLPPVRNEVLTIGHFGSVRDSINSFRNPARFFSAVEKIPGRIKLVFYGPADISPYWRSRLAAKLEIHPAVSHEESLRLMQKMDLLLVLHSQKEGADEVIPAKFYEYILVEKPILSVGPKDMEVSRMVTQKSLGYVMDIYDEPMMIQKLNEIYTDWENNRLVKYNRDDYPEFSRQYQYAKILNILV